MNAEDYDKYLQRVAPRESLYEFFQRSAAAMEEIELEIPPRIVEEIQPGIFDDEIDE